LGRDDETIERITPRVWRLYVVDFTRLCIEMGYLENAAGTCQIQSWKSEGGEFEERRTERRMKEGKTT
jgi:hypothetical protein